MNKENASKLWKMIQEAGDYLQGQLPEHPNHPKGRNPYAHVALCVKEKFTEEDWLLESGVSRYDIENKDKLEKIVGFKINQRTHI